MCFYYSEDDNACLHLIHVSRNGNQKLLDQLQHILFDCILLDCFGLVSVVKDCVVYHIQGIMADALKCLGDNKKVVREAVIKMLDSWVLVLQLDKMVYFFQPFLFLW